MIRETAELPHRGGTTYMILEPLDFIARLAAWVPIPCVNLNRFHLACSPPTTTCVHV